MKLLLDANLSWRLMPLLSEHFGECIHINKTGLPQPASDGEVWDYAEKNDCVIVTQDSDFVNFLETRGYPPKVVLLRLGNLSRKEAGEILLRTKVSIEELVNGNYGLLEIV
jgi:predicted nuclease of predicted toxin-antitoxin system